jgi:hypothetical protein
VNSTTQRLKIHGRDFRFRTSARKRTSPIVALLVFFLFLAISAVLTGCQIKAKINDVKIALTTVKKIVLNNLPQGLREESANGRELTSGYFSPHKWEEDATDKSERAYAKVLILGSGRPYSIDVKVVREKKRGSRYANLGEDRKLTKELVDRLKESLADRRDDRNIIDDFRAF